MEFAGRSPSRSTSANTVGGTGGGSGSRDLAAWDTMVESVTRTESLRALVLESGIPHGLRPAIWMRLSGATTKRFESDVTYKQVRDSVCGT